MAWVDIAALAWLQGGGPQPHFFSLDVLAAVFGAFHEISRFALADN